MLVVGLALAMLVAVDAGAVEGEVDELRRRLRACTRCKGAEQQEGESSAVPTAERLGYLSGKRICAAYWASGSSGAQSRAR